MSSPKPLIWVGTTLADLKGFPDVYTVKLAGYVYALHAFQKKSRKGGKTALADIEKVKARLKLAEDDHAERTKDDSDEDEE